MRHKPVFLFRFHFSPSCPHRSVTLPLVSLLSPAAAKVGINLYYTCIKVPNDNNLLLNIRWVLGLKKCMAVTNSTPFVYFNTMVGTCYSCPMRFTLKYYKLSLLYCSICRKIGVPIKHPQWQLNAINTYNAEITLCPQIRARMYLLFRLKMRFGIVMAFGSL